MPADATVSKLLPTILLLEVFSQENIKLKMSQRMAGTATTLQMDSCIETVTLRMRHSTLLESLSLW
jgi:hypothetical protein